MSTPEALRLDLAGEREDVLRQLDDRTNQMWNAKRKRWAALVRAQAVEIERLTAERDALREALQRIVDWDAAGLALTEDHINQARAALQQPKEQSNG